jgi:para-aminobenzoate synthetase component 1
MIWRDPVAAFQPFAEDPCALLLLSRGEGENARWSYLARRPRRVETVAAGDSDRDFARLRAMLGPRQAPAEGPPFQGGVVGLAAYEFGDRLEPLGLRRDPDWPDLTLAEYRSVLAFDHANRALLAVGRGVDAADAASAADEAASWLSTAPRDHSAALAAAADDFQPLSSDDDYEASVRDVIDRIAAGELFQANIARTWAGSLRAPATPFDVFTHLQSRSPAPFCAFWRLPGLALVSHSPERFVRIGPDGRSVQTRPIKGTRPRGANPARDAALQEALLSSDKDRAENLMIVDLMRNDLARVCAAGQVRVPEMFRLESFEAVHHLTSTVTGLLAPGLDAADLLAACFPPGSITGAPKVQAMRVIATHEPPRGPWCGSLFWAGHDGAFDSSVLIRTAAFVEDASGWRFRASAGAGIVADSDPLAERLETEIKVSGLARALTEPPR